MNHDEARGIKKFLIGVSAPLAVLIVIQITTSIWWSARIDLRMTITEQRLERLENVMFTAPKLTLRSKIPRRK